MILPITIWKKPKDSNATNWPGVVRIDPDHPLKAAIWAQEAYEARFKLNPIAFIRSRLPKGKREMELMGHEIEVQAAHLVYGADKQKVRRDESERLHHGYGGLFKRYTPAEIRIEMRLNSAKAKAWVKKHADKIMEMK